MQLSNKLRGKTVKILSLNFNDLHILHKLNNIGLSKGSYVKVLDYQDNPKIMHLLVYGVEYVLREKDCKNIYVEKER